MRVTAQADQKDDNVDGSSSSIFSDLQQLLKDLSTVQRIAGRVWRPFQILDAPIAPTTSARLCRGT